MDLNNFDLSLEIQDHDDSQSISALKSFIDDWSSLIHGGESPIREDYKTDIVVNFKPKRLPRKLKKKLKKGDKRVVEWYNKKYPSRLFKNCSIANVGDDTVQPSNDLTLTFKCDYFDNSDN